MGPCGPHSQPQACFWQGSALLSVDQGLGEGGKTTRSPDTPGRADPGQGFPEGKGSSLVKVRSAQALFGQPRHSISAPSILRRSPLWAVLQGCGLGHDGPQLRSSSSFPAGWWEVPSRDTGSEGTPPTRPGTRLDPESPTVARARPSKACLRGPRPRSQLPPRCQVARGSQEEGRERGTGGGGWSRRRVPSLRQAGGRRAGAAAKKASGSGRHRPPASLHSCSGSGSGPTRSASARLRRAPAG